MKLLSVSTSSARKIAVLLVSGSLLIGSVSCAPQGSQTGNNVQVSQREEIKINGSSTVYPISEAIAKEYRKLKPNVKIDVKFSGTSAGFNKFCNGETDISNASRPILLVEMEKCAEKGIAFIELPVAFDALTIAVNPKNDWAKDITIDELRKTWEPDAEGKIKTWNQIRASFPNRPLNLYGAGSNSGTFDYFNEVLTGDAKGSRTDYNDSEDDNVIVQGIERDPNALGYIPFAYFEANQQRLKALAIDNGKGPVAPSRTAVEKAQYQPFSRPLFIYVNAKSAQDKPVLKAFVEYYLAQVPRVTNTVGYIPLPAEAYRLATIQFTRGEIGTVFEGVPQPNVTISELLRRQAVFQLSEQAPTSKK
ncbi:phosphate ABC transporter substrate-binding protein, PhoT family [Leptolyngbyaceae cyanobacterium JSC-12]|nr:phosphate ABC transporter substrate-binding protein, PhoT family [Leptolyngbyaceae cyanobacterium JSC-12]